MKKFIYLAAAIVMLSAVPLHAQNGCSDSPENPTALLAVFGTGGALIASLRARLRRK